MNSGIYEIVNTVNGHRYIGSAVNIGSRWRMHKHQLKSNKHHSQYLQRAWNKYSENSFEFRVLEHCFFFMLIPREQYYIDELSPEYNVCPVAGNNLGIKHTDETRAKYSDAQKKRFAENPVTDKERANRSEANKKRWADPEARAKQSETLKKVQGTPEARAKTSEAMKNYCESSEARAKKSEVMKKYYENQEARTKTSEATKRALATPEARTKASEAMKASWIRRKENHVEA